MFFACKHCEVTKPATREFFSRGSGGYLMNICKPCDAVRRIEFRESRAGYARDWMRAKAAGKSTRTRVYVSDPNTRSTSERKKEWYLANKVRAKETLQAYRKANPLLVREQVARRRALRVNAPGSHDAQDISELFAEQDGACEYCGLYMGRDFTVDHVIPLSRGGSNGIENLVCACGTCNSSKGARTGDEFRALLARKVA